MRVPTAAEYDGWATWFGDRADELTGLLSAVSADRGPDVLIGGRLAVTVDVAIRASSANSLDAATGLRELAEVCRQRADVCRTYDMAMGSFENAMDAYDSAIERYGRSMAGAEEAGRPVHGSPPVAPDRPRRPASWVER